MLFLIGVDDTDNSKSENTGELALRLGFRLEERCAARMLSITRHQLFLDSGISYTNSNQCYCILLDASQEAQRDIELMCRGFLLRECATGSNPGFALATWSTVTPAVMSWGEEARMILLNRQEAINVAKESKVSIAGFSGGGQGVIGALAAVGLFYEGSHGTFFWLPGLRSLKGIYTYTDLVSICAIDRVENQRGRRPMPGDRVNISEPPCPILRDGKSVLLLEPSKKGEEHEWNTISLVKLKPLIS